LITNIDPQSEFFGVEENQQSQVGDLQRECETPEEWQQH